MADAPQKLAVQCCIAGGGPAGMMLGYLMARAGVKTVVLEKHADFLRDFRGDTVHPSTLQAMVDLGLIDGFLKRPHNKLYRAAVEIDGKATTVVNLDHLPVVCKFIAFMPQWDFLNFLAEEGRKLPALTVMMQAQAEDLIRREDGRIAGVTGRTPDGPVEIAADLVVGADGRTSTLRDKAGLPVTDLGAPIDVFWFRVSRDEKKEDDLLGRMNNGRFIVTLDRGDYWQCAFVIGKGGADRMKAEGIEAFRRKIAEAAPSLADKVGELKSFDDLKLLTVTVDRLERWSKPGLLFIGDAAHAMSPVGGVGINLAIQDAIAAANLLAAPLAAGETLSDRDLDAVRRRRLWPVKIIQGFQVAVQDRLFKPAITAGDDVAHVNPLPIEIIARTPLLQRLVARMIGLGVRLERVRSPKA
jgi:2-polyprenyl-6-methoxyphenol hydroxylase-like FAD-dependent oxidoreductase